MLPKPPAEQEEPEVQQKKKEITLYPSTPKLITAPSRVTPAPPGAHHMFCTSLKRCVLVPDWSGMTTRKVKAAEQMKKITCWMRSPWRETRGKKVSRGREEGEVLLVPGSSPVLDSEHDCHFNPIISRLLACLPRSPHNALRGI